MKYNSLLKIFLVILTVIGIWYFTKKRVKIEHENVLIVGTNAEYRPFTFSENNQIVGFDIDIVKEIAHRLGKNIQINDMSFTALIPEMQMGKIHVIAAGMSPTEERARQVFFTEPHHAGDPLVLISKKEKPINSLAQLKGKTVVVNEGFTADTYISQIEGLDIIRLANVADAFLTLSSNRADAFVSAKTAVQPFFEQYGKDAFHIVTLPNTEEKTALAVSKQYPELYERIQQILQEMKEDGTLENLKQKWKLQ